MTLSSGGSFGSPPDLQQIVAGLDREIAENPSNALTYNRRGIAYFLLKQYQQAIENYNRAIELDTNCAVWYFNRGQAFAALGHAQSAATDFSRAYALDPQLMSHDQQPRHALPMGEALTAPYPSCQKVYHLQYWFLCADLIAIVFLILPVITLLVAITSPASFYGSQAVILISFSLFSLILTGALIFVLWRMRLVIEPLGIAYAGRGYRVYTPWWNIRGIGSRRLGGRRVVNGLLLGQPAREGLSLEEGKRLQQPVLEVASWVASRTQSSPRVGGSGTTAATTCR